MSYVIYPFTLREWILWALICGAFLTFMVILGITAAGETGNHVMHMFQYTP